MKRHIYIAMECLGVVCMLSIVWLSSGRLADSIPWVPVSEEVFFWQAVVIIILVAVRINRARKQKLTVAQVSYATEEQFIAMYERSPTPYLSITAGGRVVRCNQAAVLLFDSTSNTLPQAQFFDFITGVTRGDVSILQGKIANGLTLDEVEISLQTASGKEKWALLSTYELPASEERLVSLVDITQQKLVDTAKSEFVALATHQLRTPVSAIRWNLELLEQNLGPNVSESQVRYLTKIQRNVFRMIALINDFLSVSKLETGSFATTLQLVELSAFVTTVVDEYVEQITEKRLERFIEVSPADLVCTSDTHLLHIIISNLVSNAVKYSNSDGFLRVRCGQDQNVLLIEIANRGIGIPEDEQGSLFTKFFRASNAQAHHTEGTGLGLYAVKQSVEKLGGTIEVASVPGGETRFTVRLPL